MVTTTRATNPTNTLLLFGPQALSFSTTTFADIHARVVQNSENAWIKQTITSLPGLWDALVKEFPQYGALEGKQLLRDLDRWFETGTMEHAEPHLPNILLSPMVVITQLTEYVDYLKTMPHAADQQTETVGFCTGLLTALAASLASDIKGIRQYGAIAIKLAMIIGAVVDVQDITSPNGPSKSLAVAWDSAETQDRLNQIIDQSPEAYISVEYDYNRATITTAARSISSLQQRLRNAGLIASEIGLRGRFHCACYRKDIDALSKFCDSVPSLCLPDAAVLVLPTRSNDAGSFILSGKLHHCALRSILLDISHWYQTLEVIRQSCLKSPSSMVVSFGPERCIPPSILKGLSSIVTTAAEYQPSYLHRDPELCNPNEIAVIGMSCKVAGADDVDEFWDLLCKAESQHQEVPKERFGFESAFREVDPTRKWYGNFINEHDCFDHKFFKKSAREIAATDPQQRQMLQVAYQAVEQSGYFTTPKSDKDRKIGCYIGVCAADYEYNVACHPPNAFMATGNLKSFVAGKISHWFGWTGPGLCIDTACSSSLVAVHQACQAILTGDCTAALAGGANIITHPLWYQNLAAASFLSPTGQCKPFDASADGYCRGEGFAAVFLKKMSAAIADGDMIIGSIKATAVNQNQNCTPVFVPNAPTLSDLFRDVLDRSQLTANQITVVEAHGTGTQVGDPAEYQSIRNVLGGPSRSTPLLFGSVKGLVGHTECTSGAVSLVKTLLMQQHEAIPPQPSFDRLNPEIPVSESDNMQIATRFSPWTAEYRAALINNYGACGSNASMVVAQAPRTEQRRSATRRTSVVLDYPFRLCGSDDRALRAHSERLLRFIASGIKDGISVADLAFNVCRQSNPTLDRSLAFACRTTQEVEEKLRAFVAGNQGLIATSRSKTPREVILCFGGQISNYVGLDREVYDNVALLRKHLAICDAACRDLGVDSIFPGIFQKSPISDPVKLQTILFSTQYSSAKAWMDSGVRPVAAVGHSFGELTALCVTGILSLADAMKMIVGRATVIRDFWGEDKGSMIAVEADENRVQRLLAEAAKQCELIHARAPTIACVNGPTSYTLAGPVKSIDIVTEVISKLSDSGPSIRSKRLKVTNAFHSTLVEPLMEELEKVGQHLTFNTPTIQFERAIKHHSDATLTSDYVSDHMRNPVYFNQAVQRLAQQYPDSVWLEAGSNSTITSMASRALGSPKSLHFQAVNITSDDSWSMLITSTLSLWKQGISTNFWAYHSEQTYEYNPVLLPPYQFEPSRHWMELKVPSSMSNGKVQCGPRDEEEPPKTLWSLIEASDRVARFQINTAAPKYVELVSGHVIANTAPICPATVEVDIVVEALRSLRPDFMDSNLQPQVLAVTNQSPICIDPNRSVWLECQAMDSNSVWEWRIVSDSLQEPGTSSSAHVLGKLAFLSGQDEVKQQESEFMRLERLIGHQRCVDLLNTTEADDIIQGRNIYTTFAGVVDYGEQYRGLKKIVGKGLESAGRVQKKPSEESWLDAHLGDCFSQVGGIWVNCMTDHNPDDMFIATGFEKWVRSPALRHGQPRPEIWDVLACHHRSSEQTYLTDIFIFDAEQGALTEVILGINYHKVAKASMSKILSRLSGTEAAPSSSTRAHPTSSSSPRLPGPSVPEDKSQNETQPAGTNAVAKKKSEKSAQQNVLEKTRALLAEISGLEPSEIEAETGLADIGIDSLMGMELARDLEALFKCPLLGDELANVTTFQGLVEYVQSAVGVPTNGDEPDNTNADEASEEDNLAPSPSSSSSSTNLTEDSSLDQAETTTNISSYPGQTKTEKPAMPPASSKTLELSPSWVLEAFEESKRLTDHFIEQYRCANYVDTILPKQTQLCVALTVEAFEQLGCPIRTAVAGQKLERIIHIPKHAQLAQYLYRLLSADARLIDLTEDGRITRTHMALPKPSDQILQDLLRLYPDHEWANRLAAFTGARLAEVLKGETDGLGLVFGTDEGRELVAGLYGDSLLNKLSYRQMEDIITRLASRIPRDSGPLKILEMGAGTGGTTKGMAPLLARLGIPVEYTFTDLSGSFVAAARKKYQKEYPFMKFQVHDIEKPPSDQLRHSQHIVIASNAIHATHSLTDSSRHVREFLKTDGFLMIVEMTQPVHWVDIIFGLFDGWWLFADGRDHAIASAGWWAKVFQSVGYGQVDWTDGHRPEVQIQRVIIALASGPRYGRQPLPPAPPPNLVPGSHASRQAAVNEYLDKYTKGFTLPAQTSNPDISNPTSHWEKQCVLITGATGSLGVHLVAAVAALDDVQTVICLNRRSAMDPDLRQQQAFERRGILLEAASMSKIRVLQTDSSKPQLGLTDEVYSSLVTSTTHIIHNAWPMTGKRPLSGLEQQFQVMRNLLDLAAQCSSTRPANVPRIVFQFISSIATVGYYPLWSGQTLVPEARMGIESVLANGYGEAKYVCEQMLDRTLHQYPDRFRAMAVRLGQIAGSRTSGYWNPMEHLSFLFKSAQTLQVFPDFTGDLCWTPVNDVAATLSDLLLLPTRSNSRTDQPIYHIDNPVRQSWDEMVPVLIDALGIPAQNVIPFADWVCRVRAFPGQVEWDNPAALLIDFLDDHFLRMSCGGLLLDTKRACEHSPTLAAVGPVTAELARKYIQSWKEMGFLNP
ncbi:type I Iterative Polyketide synthase (PKS) [Aspergillus niger]|nr:type I Iterative Polyketide synthase (PKS) [Aspergillus niger]